MVVRYSIIGEEIDPVVEMLPVEIARRQRILAECPLPYRKFFRSLSITG